LNTWKKLEVLEVRDITEASFIVKFCRGNIDFKPGQHLVIAFPDTEKAREYSIYSGTKEDYLEILVREVTDGKISKTLHKLLPSDMLNVSGPFGYFLSDIIPPRSQPLLFIASGTGIAPFHSFVRTYPEADYIIIHGIRSVNEAYGKEHYKKGRCITCTSNDQQGDFQGRLTKYLKQKLFDKNSLVFLCGNNDMIHDAINILTEKGFRNSDIFTEVYF